MYQTGTNLKFLEITLHIGAQNLVFLLIPRYLHLVSKAVDPPREW